MLIFYTAHQYLGVSQHSQYLYAFHTPSLFWNLRVTCIGGIQISFFSHCLSVPKIHVPSIRKKIRRYFTWETITSCREKHSILKNLKVLNVSKILGCLLYNTTWKESSRTTIKGNIVSRCLIQIIRLIYEFNVSTTLYNLSRNYTKCSS